jgi:hypothetical protein
MSKQIIYFLPLNLKSLNLKQFYWVIQNDCELVLQLCAKMYVATV